VGRSHGKLKRESCSYMLFYISAGHWARFVMFSKDTRNANLVIPTFCVYLGLFRVQLTAAADILQVTVVPHSMCTPVSPCSSDGCLGQSTSARRSTALAVPAQSMRYLSPTAPVQLYVRVSELSPVTKLTPAAGARRAGTAAGRSSSACSRGRSKDSRCACPPAACVITARKDSYEPSRTNDKLAVQNTRRVEIMQHRSTDAAGATNLATMSHAAN
jgi:hypothetical protein